MRAAIFALGLLIGACARHDADDAAPDAWLGDWHGPEGTMLTIAGGRGAYRITVRDLDGPRSFDGSAVEDGITFERDGMPETIRATNGAGTGMKWLADKGNCLVIRAGEGFCRD